MDLGKWKSEVLIPFAHRQVFHKTRSSHSEEYHHLFCTYALQKIVKKMQDISYFWPKKLLVSKIIPIFAPVTKRNRDMPEVFRFFGFSFFFYSKEHEPVHVHVEGNGGMASSFGMEASLHYWLRRT